MFVGALYVAKDTVSISTAFAAAKLKLTGICNGFANPYPATVVFVTANGIVLFPVMAFINQFTFDRESSPIRYPAL